MSTNGNQSGMVLKTAEAVAFLSRLPVSRVYALSEKPDFTGIAQWFPVAGLIIALPALLAAALLYLLGAPDLLIACLAIMVTVIVTGALHEDGLADCADGFGGGGIQAHKLEIMRDSRIGTYGALALVFSVIVRVSCLYAIITGASLLATLAAILVAASASRAAMVWMWVQLPPARQSGLSRDYGSPDNHHAQVAAGITLAISIILLWPTAGIVPILTAAAAVFAATCGWIAICKAQIGGQTGDTLGATQQICEFALLFAIAITI